MKTLGLASFALGLLVVLTAHGGDDVAKKERAALQGVWKVVNVETPKGKQESAAGTTLHFDSDGKTITIEGGSATTKGTFKINPAAKIKEIDIVPNEDAARKMEGIYIIEKGTLKICLSPNVKADGRPSEFAVKEGKNYVLITLDLAK